LRIPGDLARSGERVEQLVETAGGPAPCRPKLDNELVPLGHGHRLASFRHTDIVGQPGFELPTTSMGVRSSPVVTSSIVANRLQPDSAAAWSTDA
jgi:hypothetical protein